MKLALTITETTGIDRMREPVRVGIPFPQGTLLDAGALGLRDEDGGLLPLQTQVLDSSEQDGAVSVRASARQRATDSSS